MGEAIHIVAVLEVLHKKGCGCFGDLIKNTAMAMQSKTNHPLYWCQVMTIDIDADGGVTKFMQKTEYIVQEAIGPAVSVGCVAVDHDLCQTNLLVGGAVRWITCRTPSVIGHYILIILKAEIAPLKKVAFEKQVCKISRYTF